MLPELNNIITVLLYCWYRMRSRYPLAVLMFWMKIKFFRATIPDISLITV